MKVEVLASGSKGNCIMVTHSNTHDKIFVDCGLGRTNLMKMIGETKLDPKTVSAIIVTHEHGDHTDGVKTMQSKYGTRVFATELTAKKTGIAATHIPSMGHFCINKFFIETFPVSHDAIDPIGLIIDDEEERAAVVLDCGYISKLILDKMRCIKHLAVECNYNRQMLGERTDIPQQTKERIASMTGHLEDQQAAEFVEAIILQEGMTERFLKNVKLVHLSKSSITPELAVENVKRELEPYPWLNIEAN